MISLIPFVETLKKHKEKFIVSFLTIVLLVGFGKNLMLSILESLPNWLSYEGNGVDLLLFTITFYVLYFFINLYLIQVKYRFTFYQVYSHCLVLSIYLVFHFQTKSHWNTYKNYLDSVFLFIAFWLLVHAIRYVRSWMLAQQPYLEKKEHGMFVKTFYKIVAWTVSLIIKTNNESTKKEKQATAFIEDTPEKDTIKDDYKKNPAVKQLAISLAHLKNKKSFTVGVIGPWGTGKTSFSSALEELIKEEDSDTIIVKYTPLYNHTHSNIIRDFFEALRAEVSIYNGNLNTQLPRYSEKLSAAWKKHQFQDLFSSDILYKDSTPVEKLYTKVNEAIKAIDRKIVVFIDDLDRLSADEILEVLKLVRNSADFHNTVFVVNYDKDYLIQMLHKSYSNKATEFLSKFFQLEFYIPQADADELIQVCIDHIISKCQIKLNKEYLTESIRNSLFDGYVTSYRDTIKFANLFNFEYPPTKEEVYLPDFINILFLKQNYPSVYYKMQRKIENFFDTNWKVKNIPDVLFLSESNDKCTNHEFIAYLELHRKGLNLDTGTYIPLMLKTLRSLFDEDQKKDSKDDKFEKIGLSINKPENFSKYFKYALEKKISQGLVKNEIQKMNSDHSIPSYFQNLNKSEKIDLTYLISSITIKNKNEFFNLILLADNLDNLSLIEIIYSKFFEKNKLENLPNEHLDHLAIVKHILSEEYSIRHSMYLGYLAKVTSFENQNFQDALHEICLWVKDVLLKKDSDDAYMFIKQGELLFGKLIRDDNTIKHLLYQVFEFVLRKELLKEYDERIIFNREGSLQFNTDFPCFKKFVFDKLKEEYLVPKISLNKEIISFLLLRNLYLIPIPTISKNHIILEFDFEANNFTKERRGQIWEEIESTYNSNAEWSLIACPFGCFWITSKNDFSNFRNPLEFIKNLVNGDLHYSSWEQITEDDNLISINDTPFLKVIQIGDISIS